MKWLCVKPHLEPHRLTPPYSKLHESFRSWLWCQVLHLSHEQKQWLGRIGFLDTTTPFKEGGFYLWRWDFWNSTIREWHQQEDRRQWEQKRGEIRRIRGEDAG